MRGKVGYDNNVLERRYRVHIEHTADSLLIRILRMTSIQSAQKLSAAALGLGITALSSLHLANRRVAFFAPSMPSAPLIPTVLLATGATLVVVHSPTRPPEIQTQFLVRR